jgi:hypothetical protein
MSERFGFDWKDQEATRIAYFMEILRLESEHQNKQNKKQNQKDKFRPRM